MEATSSDAPTVDNRIQGYMDQIQVKAPQLMPSIQMFIARTPEIAKEYTFFSVIHRLVARAPCEMLIGFVLDQACPEAELRAELIRAQMYWQNRTTHHRLRDQLQCELAMTTDAFMSYLTSSGDARAYVFNQGVVFIKQLYVHVYRRERLSARAR